jgi:hypothetical protein
MAKQKRALPARTPGDRSRDDESLLLRSAESLGRMIGALQRQLDGATKRLSETASGAVDIMPPLPGRKTATRRGTKKRSAAPQRASARNTNGGAAKNGKARQGAARKTTTKTRTRKR